MSRYEREIEEILEKIVDFPSNGSARRKPKRPRTSLWTRISRRVPRDLLSLSVRNLTIAAVVLTLLGFALRDIAPRVAPFASTIAVALFVAIIVWSFRNRRPRYEKRWRGQVLEFPRKKSTSWNELVFNLTVLWRRFRRWVGRL